MDLGFGITERQIQSKYCSLQVKAQWCYYNSYYYSMAHLKINMKRKKKRIQREKLSCCQLLQLKS